MQVVLPFQNCDCCKHDVVGTEDVILARCWRQSKSKKHMRKSPVDAVGSAGSSNSHGNRDSKGNDKHVRCSEASIALCEDLRHEFECWFEDRCLTVEMCGVVVQRMPLAPRSSVDQPCLLKAKDATCYSAPIQNLNQQHPHVCHFPPWMWEGQEAQGKVARWQGKLRRRRQAKLSRPSRATSVKWL